MEAFVYGGMTFIPKRQFTRKEKGNKRYLGDAMKHLCGSDINKSIGWSYEDFYVEATKAGAGKIDVFTYRDREFVPCESQMMELVYEGVSLLKEDRAKLEIEKKERFLTILKDLKIGDICNSYTEWHDSTGDWIFQDMRNGKAIFSEKVWSIFSKVYNMETYDIQVFLKENVKEFLNIELKSVSIFWGSEK